MQTQPMSPYEATAAHEHQGIHTAPEYATGVEEHMHAEGSPKKKSMLEKVKDKAKKFRTKIKPKAPDAADNNDESSSSYSSEDESGSKSGSEPHQQVGNQSGEEKEVMVTPGPQGEAFEAIPDPHVSGATEGTAGAGAGVEQRFGHMSLGEKPDSAKLQEEVPSAPGHVSAGVTPYLASHNLGESPYAAEGGRGIPVEEGKNVQDTDPLVSPTSTDFQEITAMDYEKTPDVSNSGDKSAAGYIPTSEDKASEEEQQQKPLKDLVSEGAAGTAAASAGALGVSEGKKSMLGQAKEKIFGTSTKAVEGEEDLQTSESKPTITERAASFKDTIATKLGYGSNKNLTAEGDNSAAALQVDAHDPENKSVLQTTQESASGATGTVTNKLGHDDTQQTYSQGEGGVVEAGETKSYTQKAYEAAYGAKDAVAAKLGYGGTASTETLTTQGEQKSYLQGAKDVVFSKLGYANRELPASTEGAYNDEQNVPANTAAARFHPGEEDRALSQLITEKMSTGAVTVKDTLMRPFGASKSGPPTPTTTPPPSSAAAIADDPVHNTVGGTHDVAEGAPYATGEEKPGIVGKVAGAVTSLLGTSGSGKKRADEATGKANEDAQAAGVCNVETH